MTVPFSCSSISMWSMWMIRAPVLTLLRTAPVITIKQLLSPDIIKAGQYVEDGVNPKDSGPACEGGGHGGKCRVWTGR